MRRPIILGSNPYIANVFSKTAKDLFDETGGNTGNLAFQYAIASHLRGNVALLPWGTPVAQLRSVGDIIVLPLANQLGPHTDLSELSSALQEINMPVLGIGLGAQAPAQGAEVQLTVGTQQWLKTIIQLSWSSGPSLGVRGAFTKSVIDKLGYESASIVTGCPSNFINCSPDLPARLARGFAKKPEHVGVMAGIPFIPEISQIEQDLADMITKPGGAYIVQHGLEMLRLARSEFDLIDPKELELACSYIRPQLSLIEFKSWCRQYAYAFYDVRPWMDFVRRFDFVVGTRFHGAMLAIQAGVPAACITHDSRTQEMCETMGVPHRHYDQIQGKITADNILDLFNFDAEQYRETRHMLASRYLRIYRDAEVPFARELLQI